MSFATYSIRKPIPAILAFILLCLAGFFGYRQLAISKFPDVSLPLININVRLPGATPAQMETEVARKVEDAVANLSKVKTLFSIATEGSASIMIEFQLERDVNEALDDVRDAMTRVRLDLPRDIEEPLIAKQEFTGGTLLTYAVLPKHTADPNADPNANQTAQAQAIGKLSWFVDDEVRRALFGVKGVGQVVRSGGLEREIRIALQPFALQQFGLSAADISDQLALSQIDAAGGRMTLQASEQTLRAKGRLDSLDALRNHQITLRDGRKLTLSQFAQVSDSYGEPRAQALLDGQLVVAFGVLRNRGSSEVAVGRAVRAKIDELRRSHPNIEFREIASTLEEAENSFTSSMTMLWEGALLAVLVVWLFLRDWRATWISALALPLSIIPTFAIMHWFNFSLNIVTLLALAVVVGILVDDAIVEIENIVRHLKMGKPPMQAAADAAEEIGIAVIATSITLTAVFIPVAFMPGIPGKFFREFGWTAAAAVMFSLAVARLLTPMMAAHLLKADALGAHTEIDPPWMQRYLRAARWALLNRKTTLIAATLFFIASLALVPFIPTTFIPSGDIQQSNLSIELAPGATLADTGTKAEAVRRLLKDIPELRHVYASIGGTLDLGDPGKVEIADVRKAALILNWGPGTERSRTQKDLERDVRVRLNQLVGARVSFLSSEPGEILMLVLAGNDMRSLSDTALAFERDIRTLKGLGSVSSNAALRRPEIVVTPDSVRAAELGVDTAAIARAVRVATSGDYRQLLAKFDLPDRQIPIRVAIESGALNSLDTLAKLSIQGTRGPVPLGAVAHIEQSSGPVQISRFNRERNITISVELNGRALGEVMAEIEKLPTSRNLPTGIRQITTGDSEVFIELFTGFLIAMGTGLFCVYAVLLLLYNNVWHPITILLAVPLSAGGAFGALLLTGHFLSLPALIGLLMLIGIATKNSILLVDYAEVAEKELGMSRFDAVLDACHKRVRPVLMTTFAMGAGMIPIALGFSSDASFRAPMAVAVIGGLITSTVLSLVVIPVAYTVIDDFAGWVKRRKI